MNAKTEITDFTLCRAFFAGWVFLYHVDLYVRLSDWLGPAAGFIRRGYLGVDGFFILSGLILAGVHPELSAKPRVEHTGLRVRPLGTAVVLRFWFKRLARIYPLQLATLAVLAALLGLGLAYGLVPRDAARFSAPALVKNLLLVQGWTSAQPGAWNYASWTISCEWAGYLLFPLLWWAMSYFDLYVALQIVIVCLVLLGFIGSKNHLSLNLSYSGGLLRFFPEFLLGIALARLVPSCADAAPRRGAAIFGGILTALGVVIGTDPLSVIGLGCILFAFAMQADAERPAMLGRLPPVLFLGRLSYAFYMSFPIAELLISQGFRSRGWLPAGHGWTFGVGMLSITLALALVLHFCVEIPCRRAADRWLARPVSLAAKPI
jgi:peptidoglycan/LPS O-acetylase OafA/YrhL